MPILSPHYPTHKHNMASHLLSLLLLLLLSSSSLSVDHPPSSEAAALLRLKSSLVLPVPDPLASWSPSSPPCTPSSSNWPSVLCLNGAVSGLRLVGLNLSGTIDIDSISALKFIRVVHLVNNSFSGPIPHFSRVDSLKAIYLSNNNFSGDIPDDFFEDMDRLKKLWIDGNAFTGAIPPSLSKAISLLELHLENNRFSGPLPDLTIPSLIDFDVSNNPDLTGKIPEGLSQKFNATSFKGDPGLCGPPVNTPCSGSGAGPSNPVLPPPKEEGKEEGVGKIVVLAVICGALVVGLLVGLAGARNRQREGEFGTLGIETDAEAMEAAAAVESSQKQIAAGGSSHKRGSGSSRGGSAKKGSGGGGGSNGGSNGGPNLVMVNEERGVFGLPDLMKAAAEVLGNGGLGSAYKAVMGNGMAVAVKRMRELNRVGKDVFDGEMRRHGRMRHRNVLPPLAYLYRREEKLVVSEYVSKGSLLFILHGDRGPDHAALDWATRLKIVRGIARGMAFLHAELTTLDVPHANLKSSNVLLTNDYEPLIVDYGFIGLVNPSQASNVLFAYKTPEAIQHRHVSPKSDVYCLGVLILEILTGKFPSQYLNNSKGGTDVVQWTASAVSEKREAELLDPNISKEKSSVEEMVRLLRVGAACTEASLEDRPGMKKVAEMVEEIAKSCGAAAGGSQEKAVAASPAAAAAAAAVGMLQRTESVSQKEDKV